MSGLELRRIAYAAGDFTRDQWQRLLYEHEHRCYYCGALSFNLTLDHKTPIRLGGSHTKDNIVPACAGCNSSKGRKTAEQFKALPPTPPLAPSALSVVRRSHGLTQEDLAKKAGVGQSTIAKIEQGESRPRHKTARALATALGIEPSEIDWPASNGKVASDGA